MAWRHYEYGKYFCITDRAVGFQSAEGATRRYSGNIELDQKEQKFFIDIIKINPSVGNTLFEKNNACLSG
jgi:hypothetical protein